MICFTDLSGLTLQSGPSRLVKDEYTAGLSGNGMDMDTGELVTIQHHATSPRHHHNAIPHHQFQATNIIINQGQSKTINNVHRYLAYEPVGFCV